MPFIELFLRCPRSEQPRYESALEDVGALAVTLLDADADTSNEHAILEPGVGETPLWDDVQLSALFAARRRCTDAARGTGRVRSRPRLVAGALS